LKINETVMIFITFNFSLNIRTQFDNWHSLTIALKQRFAILGDTNKLYIESLTVNQKHYITDTLYIRSTAQQEKESNRILK
jgi:hypothetical protein